MEVKSIENLSNEELTKKTFGLRAQEHALTLTMLRYLTELERRGLYKDAGCSSMFEYCIRKLNYSESGASRRIRCARVLAKYPLFENALQSNVISLTSLSMAASILTDENHGEVLKAISHKNQREVESYVATYRPAAMPRERVKAISVAGQPIGLPLSAKSTETASAPPVAPQRAPEQRFELRFSISSETKELFEEAKRLLSGKHPAGVSIECLFEELLSEFVSRKSPVQREERRKKRVKSTTTMVVTPKAISRKVKDAVFLRDGGRCSYTAPDGTRCSSCWDLEVDHLHPKALGGRDDIENLRLLCRAHNMHAATKTFGKEFIAQRIRAG